MLWKWDKRRHPQKSNKWIKKRYWHTKGNRQWSFRTEKVTLFQMMDTPIVRIKSLELKKDPYLDAGYFKLRRESHRRDQKTAFALSTAALSEYYAL